MKLWGPHIFIREAVSRTYTFAKATELATLANRLQRRGLPVLFSLGHLSWHTGIRYQDLQHYIWRSRRPHPYRLQRMMKRSGQFRQLRIPCQKLLFAQRWINRFILAYAPVHPAAFAYVPGRSAVDCARVHIGHQWLIKVDISHFFESIDEFRVYHVFNRLGLSPLVSFQLSRLCTVLPQEDDPDYEHVIPAPRTQRSQYKGAPYFNSSLGFLPQGGACSPALSNLVFYPIDERIARLTASKGWFYSRYSDDIFISTSDKDKGRINAVQMLHAVRRILTSFGYVVNAEKTRILSPRSRRSILGLTTSRDGVHVSRKYHNRIRSHLYYAKKYGVQEHVKRIAKKSHVSSSTMFRLHMLGMIKYVAQLHPEKADVYLRELTQLPWNE